MCTNSGAFILIAFAVGLTTCSKDLHRYDHAPRNTFPRMIYVEDQVQSLNTEVELPRDNQMFVEIRKKNGENQYGRLLRITETELVVSQGYHYSAVDDSTFKKENRVVIPKEDVLILKVF